MSRCLKWLILVVATVIIAFAVLINAARFLIPLLNSESVFFQKWASGVLHQPVHIGKITTGWSGFNPTLNFQQVAVTDAENNQTLLHISQLSISVDLFHSLIHWQLLPGHLLISGATLSVYQHEDGSFQLQGLDLAAASAAQSKVYQLKNVLLWLLTQSDVALKQINIDYHTANGELIPIENLRLQVINTTMRHQIMGATAIKQAPTQFRFVLNMQDIRADHLPGKADLYVQAQQVLLQQLLNDQWARKYLQRWQVVSGNANLQFWVKWQDGHLTSAQSLIDVTHVGINSSVPVQLFTLNHLQANLYWQAVAGIEDLSATIDVTADNHTLPMQAAIIDMPAWFSQPLAINQLHLSASWRRDNTGWQLTIPSLNFADNNMDWRGNLSLIKPLTSAPTINTALQFNVKNLALLPHYLPQHGLKPGLFAWLNQAFLGGSMTDGKIILQGALDQFPFDHGQGQFDMTAHLNNLILRYSPHWPTLENLQGTITAHDSQLQILAEKATTLGSPIYQVLADIPDLRKPLLTITGRAVTDMTRGMKFLHQSPLTAAKEMAGMVATGPMTLNLKLIIPLDDKKDIVSDGQIDVHQGHLYLPNWHLKLAHIDGLFHFHNHDLNATKVAATLYDMPLTVDLTTLHPLPNQSMLQLSMNGQLNMALLQREFNTPLLKYFQGNTNYQALLQVHDEDTGIANHLKLTSNLLGIQSSLPAPYSKTPTQAQPFLVNMDFSAQRPLHMEVSYSDDFSAAVSALIKNQQWQLQSGEIHLGAGKAHYQSQPGLLITAKLNQFDVAAWQAQWAHQQQNSNTSWWRDLPIRAVELSFDHLDWDPYHLTDAYVSITPMNKGWMVLMQNAMVAGRLFIPQDHQHAWHAHFTHLYLLHGKNAETPIDPRRLPPLQVTIDDFRYDQKTFGKIMLQTARVPAGLQITTLNMLSPLANMQAVGTWQIIHDKPQTTLYGTFMSTDLGTALKNWQVTQVLVGGKGTANFSLSWAGAPQQFAMAHLNGDVKFDFRDGRVTHLSQSAESELGFGKLLNLFSLQSIPLLPLNVAHLNQKGFAFNLFKGDFQLSNGNAVTTNTSLVGPVAWVQVNGQIGFAKKNYNLDLQVIPNVTSSLPLIVGLAGGPLAGAITWIADKMLAHQVGRAAQVNYRITGSWDKPSIEKLPKPAETK